MNKYNEVYMNWFGTLKFVTWSTWVSVFFLALFGRAEHMVAIARGEEYSSPALYFMLAVACITTAVTLKVANHIKR